MLIHQASIPRCNADFKKAGLGYLGVFNLKGCHATMTLQEILIRAYFVLLSLLLLLLYAYYVRRSIARKFKHVHCKKFTAACCNVWTSYRSWSYLFATLPCDESLSCFKIVGLPLYAEAVSALFFFLCLIRHDLKPINMKNCGNFHFPTRLKISYIINSLKDLYRILWRMRVKNAGSSLSQTIGVSEETSWVCPSCW